MKMKIINKIYGTSIKLYPDEHFIITTFTTNKFLLDELKDRMETFGINYGELQPYEFEHNLSRVSHIVEILDETVDNDVIYVNIKLKCLDTWWGKQLKIMIENNMELIPTIYHIEFDNKQRYNVNINPKNSDQRIRGFWANEKEENEKEEDK